MTIKQDKDMEITRAEREARLVLKLQNLEQRWRQANEKTMLYVRDFERLGVAYTPLIVVTHESFDTHSCYKYVGQENERLFSLENDWKNANKVTLMFMEEYANRGLIYRSLSVSKDQN